MSADRHREMLNELLSGKLSADESDYYAKELAKSAWFTDIASQIAPKEELLALVRTQIMGAAPLRDDRVRSLMSQLRDLNRPQSQPQPESDRTMIQGAPTESAADGSNKLEFLSPAQSPDEIGRIEGYRILQILGEGGMGTVFMAEDIRLKRKLAIKVMKPEIAAVEVHRLRFMREAQTVAQLDHDNIIPIYHVGEEKGVPFITMPLLKGESLEDRLKNKSPMPMRDVIRFGRQMAEGLEAAHAQGVIHRDIKPANVWIEMPKDRVRILDFGLARASFDNMHLTLSGAVMGTPAYMAPEQTRGEKVDHRADLYSLGVLLYQMSTGTPQYKGSNLVALLKTLAGNSPPSPQALNPEVPFMLNKLVVDLLQKDANKRPQKTEEVANRLRGMEDSPTERYVPKMKPIPFEPQTSEAPKPKMGLIIGIVVVVVVLGAGVALLLK